MSSKLIHDYLPEVAARTPHKEALVGRHKRLTYADFERISNQVALYLRRCGVSPGDRVAISMQKCVDYVCCLFGVMKAGAVYVPIDHEYPTQRIFQILEETEITTALMSTPTFTRLQGDNAFPGPLEHAALLVQDEVAIPEGPIGIESFAKLEEGDEPFDRPTGANAADLAYILYTSGSTGRPKGVMLTHGNIMAFVDWCHGKWTFRPEDRLLQTAPFTFDISGLDMFCALTSGATLVIVEDQRLINTVLSAITKEKVTFMSTVPTVYASMVQNPRAFKRYDLSSLHTVVTGSAVIQPSVIKKIHEYLPQATLHNLYGPTEATIYILCHDLEGETLDGETPVPIGKAFRGSDAFVVTADGKEAATDEQGELVLRGPQIARGYYKNPQKTAEAFRSNPLRPDTLETVYYTGDVVRKDGNGVVHFHGRRDDLVKSRGYRIELNEIEIALGFIDDQLAEYAAFAVPHPMWENKLYAAVVLNEGVTLDADAIKSVCSEKIPHYMVPDEVLIMDRLPKTSSGKLSRKMLRQQVEAGEAGNS